MNTHSDVKMEKILQDSNRILGNDSDCELN